MAIGHSQDIDAGEAIESVIDQCRQALQGAVPNGGLLFSTYDTEPDVLVSRIRAAMPGIELIGSTAAGEMSSILGFQEDSVTLAVFASDVVDIKAGLGTNLSSDSKAAAQEAVGDARRKTDKEARLCIALPSVARHNPSDLLEHLREELGEGVAVLGGGSAGQSSRDEDMINAYQFCNEQFVHDAVPILLFSGPLVYSFGIDTGWRPVGRKAKVTRASQGVVHEIDGEPALAFYQHYLGADVEPTPANPLAVFASDSDEFYLRVPTLFDPVTGSITVAGDLPTDATVQLTVAMTDEIFEGTKSAINKAIKGYPDDSKPAGALVFSCAIRKFVLGTRAGTELEITRDELGPTVPICGFYAYGEIGPTESGISRWHNETMVALLLGSE
jgi:hypothetical protein